jgi:extracellular factor (EF) 3-hydroxypalmitic acid methyl ester biosynthesis protein
MSLNERRLAGVKVDADELLAELECRATVLANERHRPDVVTPAAFHEIVGRIHEVCAAARRCEDAGLSREDMDDALGCLREACRESPFFRHISDWPNGYAGDFQIIDQICKQSNKALPGTFGYWLEEYTLISGIAQQHRNKVHRQGRELLSMVRARAESPSPGRFLILACGGCPDLEQVQEDLASLPFRGVAVDLDPEAIKASTQRLPKLADRMQFIEGNVVKKIPELARCEPFDLVVAGGLFDYLPDKVAKFVVRNVCTRLLRPGGRFFFTNIARGNPYEDWTRYVSDWRLIQRSEPDLEALIAAAELPLRTKCERDLTKLTVLVTVETHANNSDRHCEDE